MKEKRYASAFLANIAIVTRLTVPTALRLTPRFASRIIPAIVIVFELSVSAFSQTGYDPPNAIAPTSQAECGALNYSWRARVNQLQSERDSCNKQMAQKCSSVGPWECNRLMTGFNTAVWDTPCGQVTATYLACRPAEQNLVCGIKRSQLAYEDCEAKLSSYADRQRQAEEQAQIQQQREQAASAAQSQRQRAMATQQLQRLHTIQQLGNVLGNALSRSSDSGSDDDDVDSEEAPTYAPSSSTSIVVSSPTAPYSPTTAHVAETVDNLLADNRDGAGGVSRAVDDLLAENKEGRGEVSQAVDDLLGEPDDSSRVQGGNGFAGDYPGSFPTEQAFEQARDVAEGLSDKAVDNLEKMKKEAERDLSPSDLKRYETGIEDSKSFFQGLSDTLKSVKYGQDIATVVNERGKQDSWRNLISDIKSDGFSYVLKRISPDKLSPIWEGPLGWIASIVLDPESTQTPQQDFDPVTALNNPSQYTFRQREQALQSIYESERKHPEVWNDAKLQWLYKVTLQFYNSPDNPNINLSPP